MGEVPLITHPRGLARGAGAERGDTLPGLSPLSAGPPECTRPPPEDLPTMDVSHTKI